MLKSLRGSTSPQRSERSCVLARDGMVCASVPIAASIGVDTMRRGGNAIDAAIATAAVLAVVEPMQTGIGGDAFALVWSAREARLFGLNGSGRAPAAATLAALAARGHETMPAHGILSVTVPGTVHAWETLSTRLGALPLADVIAPAVRIARDGFAVTELVAHFWDLLVRAGALRNDAARGTFASGSRAPRVAETFRNPRLAATLERIAHEGAKGFYAGPVADAIVATSRDESGWLAHDDLAAHASTFVEPISTSYRGFDVFELPPNGQGVSALVALNVLSELPVSELDAAEEWHRRIEAIKLAFADRDAYVADPEHVDVPVARLLDRAYARRRAALVGDRALAAPPPGLGSDTTYLCAADAEGNLVSFIQSLFGPFGSGIACGETGVVLQNRGSGFRLDPAHPNALAPRKRPLHTIIPAMLARGARPTMAFGIMGGDVQPQAHLAFVSNLVDHGMSPQEALDRPRFRFQGERRVLLEAPELRVKDGSTLEAALAARGHEIVRPAPVQADQFGGGQAIERLADGTLVGASDRRKDGLALPLHR